MGLLEEEYMEGKIIRFDEKTYNRLAEFAKAEDLEDPLELINRLLDKANNNQTQTQEKAKK